MPFIPLEVYADNATTTVTSGGALVPAGTQETWTVTAADAFPVIDLGATQFHVADPAAPTEMVTVLSRSGSTWLVQRGADGTTPVAHTPPFTAVQVVTAGALTELAYPPWQFPVQRYGAQGDGKPGTGGTGAAGTAVFTDAGASFVNAAAPAGDVGKLIVINQGPAGVSTNPFCGTITAVNSPTSVTLSGNLTANAVNAPYIYGTDDAGAICAALAAAGNWAADTGNYRCQVMFEPCNYMLGAMTQQTGTYNYNTHLPVPAGTQYGRKLVIDLIGTGGEAEPDYWETVAPSLQGTCLVSAVFSTGQPDGTYGQSSVIGVPHGGTGLSPGGFANVLLELDGITIVCPWNSQMYGLDAMRAAACNVTVASFLAFAGVNYNGQPCGGPTFWANRTTPVNNGVSTGFAFPTWLNNDNTNIGWLTVEGATYGVQFTEHFTAGRVAAIYCHAGISVPPLPGTVSHGCTIGYYSCEFSDYCLQFQGGSQAGANLPLFIGQMDSETINTAQVDDPDSAFAGVVYCTDVTSGHPTVNGGQRLTLIDTSNHVPGPWAGAPAPPAAGGASSNTQQNTAYRPATLYASATTITGVWAGRAATGLTQLTGVTQASGGQGVTFRVPPGHYWSAAYTGTLTVTWVLD